VSIVEKAARRLRVEEENDRRPTPGGKDRGVKEFGTQPASDEDQFELEIDQTLLQRNGLMPPPAMNYLISREYQRIKRPLLDLIARYGDSSQRSNCLMITSAKPHEGKSFTIFNLALSLALEIDHKVLLVDADLRRPRLTRSLGLSARAGLADILTNDDMTLEQAVVRTDQPGLSILPAGQHCEQSFERLSSRRMRSLVEYLASDPHRIVLFDSAPLLYAAESQALAMHMGQVVFVIKASSTERRAVNAALSLLDPSKVAISLVLNQTRKGLGDDYESYYGIYGDDVERDE